jgi:subtilisin-like proprotein convertase family protein
LFTGDPNGAWALRICDDAGGDSGALRFLRLNFQPYDCNGVLGGPAMPGTACNDNDVCTTNDV